MRSVDSSALIASLALLLSGCASVPNEPVMRPIPPPPAGPPAGAATVVYAPPSTATPVATNLTIVPPGVEVSSNFVAHAQTNLAGSVGTAVNASPQGTPQYELIPPRPGPNYFWRDGFWQWQGSWVWIPGQWEYRPPPAVIFVPEPGFHYHYRFGPRLHRPWHHPGVPPPHRRWRY
jgi:hypothetical protein